MEAEEDENDTPAMEPDSAEASGAAAATGTTPRETSGATGTTPGREEGRGGVFGRRGVAGRSPERVRRVGLAR